MNDVVFNQGEMGDLFYIILAGAVSISVHDADTDTHTVVAHLGAGASFGELSLLNNEPRAATVRAAAAASAGGSGGGIGIGGGSSHDATTSFAVLDRAGFMRTIKRFHDRDQRKTRAFLSACPFFAASPANVISSVAAIGAYKKFVEDAVVIRQVRARI